MGVSETKETLEGEKVSAVWGSYRLSQWASSSFITKSFLQKIVFKRVERTADRKDPFLSTLSIDLEDGFKIPTRLWYWYWVRLRDEV